MDFFPTVKDALRRVKTYEPGKPIEELAREYGVRRAIKMASNENALGPSPKAVAAAKKALAGSHRYPDGGCFALRKKLSAMLRVRPDQLIFGNGSDEVLVLAVRAFAGPGDEIVIADPTFLIYEIAATAEGARVVKVPIRDYRYDLGSMLSKINERTRIVFIANPDNPVGTYTPTAALEHFLSRVPKHVLVVLDEAYFEFARSRRDYPDALKFLERYGNLLVTRTFSKAYGLSGLRIGYGIAAAPVIHAMKKVREPFNVNSLAQAAALAALDDRDFLRRSVKAVETGRAYLTERLKRLGLETVETATNFILVDLKRDVAAVYEKLLRQGVIVRPMSAWGMKTFLRVTIGKSSENRRFIVALKRSLKE